MKKYLLILTMVLGMLAVQASENGEASAPKAKNYKEVISKVEYPRVCKEKGIEGKVIVMLKIDVEGKVISHEFISYPCDDLKDAVQVVLNDLEFVPAKNKDGMAITGSVALPINFRLTI